MKASNRSRACRKSNSRRSTDLDLEMDSVEMEQMKAKDRLARDNLRVNLITLFIMALLSFFWGYFHVHLAGTAAVIGTLHLFLYFLERRARTAAALVPFCYQLPLLLVLLATGGFRSPFCFAMWLTHLNTTYSKRFNASTLPPMLATLASCVLMLLHHKGYFSFPVLYHFEGEDFLHCKFTLVVALTVNASLKSANMSEFTLRALQKEIDSNKAKSRFVAMVSHEMRTPLTTILGWLELFSMKDLPPEIKSNLKVVKNSSNMLLSLINDILDFSKIDQGKLILDKHVFNLELMQCVESNRVLFKKGVNFNVEISLPGVNFVFGDSRRMTQIINNFISNAAKFTEKGEVEFSVSVGEKNQKTKEFFVYFQVSDTGIGMSNAALKKIFQPFVQADSSLARAYGGTGLGLVIAQQLVTMMEGTIEVASQLGVGSTFSWKIKLKHVEEPPSRNSGHFDINRIAPPATKRKVLLVEDNKMNQAIISKLLEMHCYEVTTADNGEEAVKAIQSANYDVVLMDFQMPVLDGIAATKKIRELKIITPIIGLTANADEFAQQESTAAGMCGLIMKPVKGNDLKTTIEKTLDELAVEKGNARGSLKL